MTDKPDEPALLLTVPDAAKLLSLSRVSVFKLLRQGDLASLTIGRKRLIPRADLDRFISERATRARLSGKPNPPARA